MCRNWIGSTILLTSNCWRLENYSFETSKGTSGHVFGWKLTWCESLLQNFRLVKLMWSSFTQEYRYSSSLHFCAGMDQWETATATTSQCCHQRGDTWRSWWGCRLSGGGKEKCSLGCGWWLQVTTVCWFWAVCWLSPESAPFVARVGRCLSVSPAVACPASWFSTLWSAASLAFSTFSCSSCSHSASFLTSKARLPSTFSSSSPPSI